MDDTINDYTLVKEPTRINQGGERLLTVRPRHSIERDERGSVASLKFHLPEGTDMESWGSNLTPYERSVLLTATDGGFVDFAIQNISFEVQQRSQIMQTFGGKECVYFYGESPVMLQVQGIVMDDLDNDQFVKFLTLYRKFIGGSAAAKEYATVELITPNANWTGSFMSIGVQQAADRDTDVNFNFSFLARSQVLRSTDTLFKDEDGAIIESFISTRPRDPSITADGIERLRAANADNASLSVNQYAYTIGTGPSIGSIGFSAADLASLFDVANQAVAGVVGNVAQIAGAINDYVTEVLSYIEAVEDGIDGLDRNLETVTSIAYGAASRFQNGVATIMNFPDNIGNKLKGLGSTDPRVTGSESMTSADAMASMSLTPAPGAARGTPEGTPTQSTDADTSARLVISVDPTTMAVGETEDTIATLRRVVPIEESGFDTELDLVPPIPADLTATIALGG